MKHYLVIFFLFFAERTFAQNTFPSSGSVGIGTISPSVSLDVKGSINFNDKIYNQGVLTYASKNGNPILGQNKLAASIYSIGNKLYKDETFLSGMNSINVYDNYHSGKVTIERIPATEGAPNKSGYVLEVKHTGNQQSPGYGGFYFANGTRPNATFACIFKAKLPLGYKFNFASNSYGSGSASYWATDNNGTGKWEDYVYVVRCGNTGNFSSTNFFYLSGETPPSDADPLVWHLSSATVFDCDDRVQENFIGINKSLFNNGKLNFYGDDGSASRGQNKLATLLYSKGKKINSDEDFSFGLNGIKVYDNNNTQTVDIQHKTDGVAVPNSTGNYLEIIHSGDGQSPGYGGFAFQTLTRGNATLACVFKAKLPVGYTLNFASNSSGAGAKFYWATDNRGTGKWEDYVHVVRCGDSGSFSSTNYFYLTGQVSPSSTSPLIWHISSATVYDTEDGNTFNTGRINVGQNLGVGISDPSALIQTNGEVKFGQTANPVRINSTSGTGIIEGSSESTFIFRNLNNTADFQWESGTSGNDLMVLRPTGQLGIGTFPEADFGLTVRGKTLTEKVIVRKESNWNWPDFVFEDNYKLPALTDVKKYIKDNKHLPEIPSASDVEKEGQDLAEMNRLLLKKVEELTLYLIEQNDRLDCQEKLIKELRYEVRTK